MRLRLFALITAASLCLACSSQVTLTARAARFPVCITEGIYDSNYQLLARDQYETVHHFNMHFTAYNSAKYIEIGPALTDTLRKYQGDAIHNLHFKVQSNKWRTYLMKSLAWIFTLGLGVPSYSEIEMEGDVIRVIPTHAAQ